MEDYDFRYLVNFRYLLDLRKDEIVVLNEKEHEILQKFLIYKTIKKNDFIKLADAKNIINARVIKERFCRKTGIKIKTKAGIGYKLESSINVVGG
jgi:hypothetical protein